MAPVDVKNQLRKVQANLKNQHQPVPQVEQALKQVHQMNRFIKEVFQKEYGLRLSAEQKSEILCVLSEINKVCLALNQKSKTPHHFEMQAHYFMSLIHKIHLLYACIHHYIENSLCLVETRGMTIHQTILLSWKNVQDLYHATTGARQWPQIPFPVVIEDREAKTISLIYQRLQSFVPELLTQKQEEFSQTDFIFSVKSLSVINPYFLLLNKLYQLQDSALWRALKQKETAQLSAPCSFLELLKNIERLIQQYKNETQEPLLRRIEGVESNVYEEMLARLYELYMPLESQHFFSKHELALKQIPPEMQEAQLGLTIQGMVKQTSRELQLLQYFSKNLLQINLNLQKARAILHNLSISFGKMFQLSAQIPLTSEFLQKAFSSIHGLLQKSLRVLDSHQDELQKLKQFIEKAGLFHKTVELGMMNNITLLQRARQSILDYDQTLDEYTEQLGPHKKLPAHQIKGLLRSAFKNQAEINTASIYIENVSHGFSLILTALQPISQTIHTIVAIPARAPREQLKQVLLIFEKKRQESETSLKALTLTALQETWFIEDVLLRNVQEEIRFAHELQRMIEPIKARIQHKKIADSQPKALQEIMVVKNETPPPQLQEKQKKQKKQKKNVSTKNIFDPFPQEIMARLKSVCKSLNTDRSLMLHEALDHTHAFFNYLDILESSYEEGNRKVEDDRMAVLESDSVKELLLNFLGMKFNQYGIFDSHGQKYPYNKETRQFERPAYSDAYLRFTSRTLETPHNILRRFFLVITGFDEPEILNWTEHARIIEIMKADYIFTKKEKSRLKEQISFLP
ncbi:hypothetical protein WDW89_11705 [Deltaproteobacteria bacterium TL4]